MVWVLHTVASCIWAMHYSGFDWNENDFIKRGKKGFCSHKLLIRPTHSYLVNRQLLTNSHALFSFSSVSNPGKFRIIGLQCLEVNLLLFWRTAAKQVVITMLFTVHCVDIHCVSNLTTLLEVKVAQLSITVSFNWFLQRSLLCTHSYLVYNWHWFSLEKYIACLTFPCHSVDGCVMSYL